VKSSIVSYSWVDPEGNPAGGSCYGRGFAISWQNGPLGREADRVKPNGAFVEDILEAAKQRLEFYQSSKFNCEANADAIKMINNALDRLQSRTADRERRNVEGTHEA